MMLVGLIVFLFVRRKPKEQPLRKPVVINTVYERDRPSAPMNGVGNHEYLQVTSADETLPRNTEPPAGYDAPGDVGRGNFYGDPTTSASGGVPDGYYAPGDLGKGNLVVEASDGNYYSVPTAGASGGVPEGYYAPGDLGKGPAPSVVASQGGNHYSVPLEIGAGEASYHMFRSTKGRPVSGATSDTDEYYSVPVENPSYYLQPMKGAGESKGSPEGNYYSTPLSGSEPSARGGSSYYSQPLAASVNGQPTYEMAAGPRAYATPADVGAEYHLGNSEGPAGEGPSIDSC